MLLRIEGFGLVVFEVLFVSLSVFVSGNSGFGEVFKKVLYGFYCVVDFENF